jgi:hypothetical protein
MPQAEKTIVAAVALLLLVALCVVIWKWAKKYDTPLAKGAAALMFAGLFLGIGVPVGFLISAAGLLMMLIARKKAIATLRQDTKKCLNCDKYVQSDSLICSNCGNRFPKEVGGVVLEE